MTKGMHGIWEEVDRVFGCWQCLFVGPGSGSTSIGLVIITVLYVFVLHTPLYVYTCSTLQLKR